MSPDALTLIAICSDIHHPRRVFGFDCACKALRARAIALVMFSLASLVTENRIAMTQWKYGIACTLCIVRYTILVMVLITINPYIRPITKPISVHYLANSVYTYLL